MSENIISKQPFDREYDLNKTQIYADRTHTALTIWASFAFVILSLLAVFYTLLYEGIFNFEFSKMLTGWEGIFLIAILSFIAIVLMGSYHKNTLIQISQMLETVNEGDFLPVLEKLPKWNTDINKNTVKEDSDKKGKSYDVRGYTREIVIGIAIAVMVQGFYDSLNIAYGSTNNWLVPIVNSVFIVVLTIVTLIIIWLAWGRKKKPMMPKISGDYSI
jgi:hypothetical protein